MVSAVDEEEALIEIKRRYGKAVVLIRKTHKMNKGLD